MTHLLPSSISEKIAQLTAQASVAELHKAFQKVSSQYRSRLFQPFETKEERLAYLLFRLPATYAVGQEVFTRLMNVWPEFCPKSIVDIGAGPGSMLLVMEQLFQQPMQAKAIEKDSYFVELAKHYLAWPVEWVQEDIVNVPSDVPSFDCAIMSYSYGEMDEARRLKCLAYMQHAACAVVIEPGTPVGYRTILHVREAMIASGYRVIAPCPHSASCPLPASDWCHFSCRLPRTKVHKLIKEGTLGYEDEKFSYVILVKESTVCGQQCHRRIIRDPMHRSGHSQFHVCCQDGAVRDVVLSRKNESYRLAKKAGWGDAI